MKTALILLLALCSAPLFAQTNAVPTNGPLAMRTWTPQTGNTFDARVINFTTNGLVQFIGKDGKLYAIKPFWLSAADQKFLVEAKPVVEEAQAKIRAIAQRNESERQIKSLEAQGYVELTAQALNHYPENIAGKKAWIDATFYGLDQFTDRDMKTVEVSFEIEDRSGAIIACRAAKYNSDEYFHVVKTDDKVTALKKGDRIRFTGTVYPITPHGARLWYEIESVTSL